MSDVNALEEKIKTHYAALIQSTCIALNELTVEVSPEFIRPFCLALRNESEFDFKLLIDVCGVDYLHYGVAEWETESSTATGFERGREAILSNTNKNKKRFAVVYHLLSLTNNQRIRIRVYLDENNPTVDSLIEIFPSANWYEREAFDLYGIMFKGHPDLRRLLTDYGFVGHPFRKDFPLSGKVEVRYDAKLGRVIYQPVTIEPRILEPKVIRSDNRYKVGD